MPVLRRLGLAIALAGSAAAALAQQGGSQPGVSDRASTRASPMVHEDSCSHEDIEGEWRRNDGATVPIAGVAEFKDGPGGNALLFGQPQGWWPDGETKFTGIYREGGERSCRLRAKCAVYDRTASGELVRQERECILTVHPERGFMTESGSSLTYDRPALGRARPVAAPVRETPLPAQVPQPPHPAKVVQPVPQPQPLRPEPVAEARQVQAQSEEAERQRLNDEQAQFAARQLAENEANRKAVEDERARREAEYQRQLKDNAEAYDRSMADYRARVAEAERRAREERERWEAAVAACRAGDTSKCGQN